MKKFRVLSLVMASALCLSMLAGCGNDSTGGDTSGDNSPAPSGSTQTAGTIKIGGIGPLTGDAAVYGLATKQGLAPANKVGVIDADYRGEILVALYNQGTEPQSIEHGERIAQMIVTPYLTADFVQADQLSDTVRGEGGFGSTGRI